MWTLAPLLLTASLCSTTSASALGPGSVGALEPGSVTASAWQAAEQDSPQAQDAEREEYLDLLRRYNNDVGSHRFDCSQLKQQGVPQEDWPASPLFAYLDKFTVLADAGNGQAQYWVAANAAHAVEDLVERRALLMRMHERLVSEHASSEYMVDAIEELVRDRRLLGEEFVRATLARIAETSGVASIEASAILAEAAVLWKNGTPESEEDLHAAVELWQVLVDGYAGTDAAGQAAHFIFNRTCHAMRQAQHAWVKTVRQLHSQGVGEEGWPSYPLDSFRGQFEALANTGHMLASYRVEVFFPAYEQAARKGVHETLLFLSDDTSARYLVSEWFWQDVKFELLQLIFDFYTDEPWIYEEVDKLLPVAQRFSQERYVPLLESLIAQSSDERTQYQAKLVLARNLETAPAYADMQRALDLYEEIAQNSPVERQRKQAERMRREFSWVMPGAQMTNFSAKDGEGLAVESSGYRGRVLVMYFWGFWSPECVADLPWVNGLHAKYVGQPFAILGLNTDTVSYKMYRKRSSRAGIEWRSTLETKRKGPRVTLFQVANFPTSIVIDAEGVIRGRNLDHAGTEALIDQLLAEMAGEAPAETATPVETPGQVVEEVAAPVADSGLRGRVKFDGPFEPLPPLKFSAKQTEGCCAAGHEVDPTNRKRLVDAQGGLANVVVYVEVKGDEVNGKGTTVEVDQVECRFEPHVAVVPVGGKLLVKNSDGVSHNINMNSRYNGRINEMMPASTQRVIEPDRADKITIGCDVHPWMSSHVFVVETPYWALTAADGSFAIPSLPPGEHIARYWHEELGELKSERFTVAAGTATVLELEMQEQSSRGGRRRPR